jgi:deferrochelatase/peroxidase EfeB
MHTASTPSQANSTPGLFVIPFQHDPRKQFAAIQRRLGREDSLNEYIRHTGSALFAIPSGTASGGYIGENLLY